MFVKLIDGKPSKFPYTLGELRRDNPGTSFPDELSVSTLASYDVHPVIQTEAPSIDSKTHRTTQWVEFINSAWTQSWQIQRLSEEAASTNIRAERNRRLADCDWTHLSDAPVDSTPWSIYRQELRDITKQVGFPWNVVWPEKPNT
jgi:hypothetical protein